MRPIKFFGVALLLAGLVVGGPALRAQMGGTPNPGDIVLPEGYRIEVVATGLNSPTALAIGRDGGIYVAESGFLPGEEAQVLKVNPDGTTAEVAPRAGDPFIPPLLGLAVGPDGKLYFGQGTATNSGVVGLDNREVTGWLDRHPEVYDVACRDIVLTGQNFTDEEGVTTGAFAPYGTKTKPGQPIKGQLPCNGAILRLDVTTGKLELVAWGLRNPYGIGFAPQDHPVPHGALLAADNGPDLRGARPVANAPDTSLGGEDNVLEAAGTESDEGTAVEFVISLNSGDRFDKVLEPGKSYNIIVSYHRSSDSFSTHHSDRGHGRITLDPVEEGS